MLLFYTYLNATQEAQPAQTHDRAVTERKDLVIFTNKDDEPAMVLSKDTAQIFNLISIMIENDEEKNLSPELIEKFRLPPEADGWVIPLIGKAEDAPKFDKIRLYFPNLQRLFEKLRIAQKNNNKLQFFDEIQKFLNEGHGNMPWKMEERIQFFKLFDFLSLQFKDQDLKEIAERFFTFKLPEMTPGELSTLQEAHLNGAHVTVDTIETLKNWITNHPHFPPFTIKIEEEWYDEKLIALNQFLDQNIQGISRETGEVIYRITTEIKGYFTLKEPALVHKMIADQKIVSLELLEMNIERVRALTDIVQEEVAKENYSLKNLILDVYNLDDQSLIELSNLSKELSLNAVLLDIQGYFTPVGLALINEMLKAQRIRSLDLWDNRIGDAGAQGLAEALKVNTTLTSLSLSGNQIGDGGTQALAEALKVNTTLTSLNLKSNQIGGKGAQALAEALKVNTTLTLLDLRSNEMGDGGAQALAKALKVNLALTSLYLDHNQIGEAGAQALGEALEENTILTSLNLWRNQIGDEGAKALVDALTVNTTLTSLELSENQIGDEGVQALAEALTVNTTLTKLYLWNTQIGEAGKTALKAVVEEAKRAGRDLIIEGI